MGQQKDGQKDSFDVQNRFTAYFLIAIKRKKRDYLRKKARTESRESMMDFPAIQIADNSPYGIPSAASPIEDDALMQALAQLTVKERYILFQRVLYGSEYGELAANLNLRYSGIAAAYHRIIKKLRKELQGGRK